MKTKTAFVVSGNPGVYSISLEAPGDGHVFKLRLEATDLFPLAGATSQQPPHGFIA